MIISHRHKFIFLKTRKTAGSSIECALSAICGRDDVLTPEMAVGEEFRLGDLGPQNYKYFPPFYSLEWPNLISRFIRTGKAPLNHFSHMQGWRVKRRVSRTVWNSYYKFAFDRNPWDREVSWYSHLKMGGRRTGTFDEHLQQLPDANMNNHEFYSIGGKVIVDFLGRYENLQQDMDKVMAELGVASLPPVPVTNNHRRINQLPYQDMYNEKTRDLIAMTYKREIDLLGYTF